jgi:phospholipase C
LISPWARKNFVDHTESDQTSIIRLIEDLYLGGERLGGGSFDQLAGSLLGMLDFNRGQPQNNIPLILDPKTGLVQK